MLELLLPLGDVVAEPLTLPDALPDGAVVSVVEELEVVSDERGVLGVLGDADGLVRSGTVPTLSVSVRLHAMVIPPASASAQSPDSNFFIADDPPCGVCFDPPRRAATAMPVVRCEPASVTSVQRRLTA
ncbi:MAG TPA: hypothetical protein VE932_22185 [Patescibacteria group bacterium]|nr:hypothetical protein [Patescibacteria group bacterium]